MIDLIIGVVGMLFILIGFVLEEFWNKFNQDTIAYNLLNILGAGLLIYYAYSLRSWPFGILNGVWVLAALVKLIKILKK
tara:strand:- start:168 stop:404 length:237 start_codon:yes stop_codon:yes gene_type:complete